MIENEHAYEPGHGFRCPVTGKLVPQTWTDNLKRPHVRKCEHCDDDKRTIAERLHDLNEKARCEHEGRRRAKVTPNP